MNPWAIDEASSQVAESGERLEIDEVGRALRQMFGTLPRGLRAG